MNRSRVYEHLLRIYPADFRTRFGDSMGFAFAEQAQEASGRGRVALVLFWLRSVAHLAVFGGTERLASLRPNGTWGNGMKADFGHAARRLRRSPGFTATAVVTLALGIGATSAIYSVVHGIVLNPLAYPNAERLVSLRHDAPGGALYGMGTSHGTYVHYREYQQAFDAITVFTPTSFALTGDAGSARLSGALVSRDFFEIFLDGSPTLGRAISDADQVLGAPSVAMISSALWGRRFGADPTIIGTSIRIDGVPVEVVGVLPPGFDTPSINTQLWLPQQIDPAIDLLGGFGRTAVARLKPDLTPEQGRADLQRLMPSMSERFNPVAFELIVASGKLTAIVEPLRDTVIGDVEHMLWILLGTVSFVMLIACANVANLFLVRADAQRREIAVRAALGAGRARIIRHHLAESLVLGMSGGLGGMLLAWAAVNWLVRWGPEALPRLHEVTLGAPILMFGATLSVGAGLLLGLIPVIRLGTITLSSSMSDGGRGSTQSRSSHRVRNMLVGAQIALALVLLVGAGLMVRTFQHLSAVDPGFEADSSLVFRVGLPQALFPDPTEAMQFQQQLLETLSAIPGVASVGATGCLPLDGCDGRTPVYAEGVPFVAGDVPPAVDVRGVTNGYFRAMGIALVEGRTLEPNDHLREPAVAVVSRNLAARLWPGESAIGKRIFPDVPDDPPYTVVGVVGDVMSYNLAQAPPEYLYVQYLGPYGYVAPPHRMTFVLHTEVAPLTLAPAVRAAVRELDPNVPLSNLRTMRGIVADAGAPTAFAMILLVTAGGVALLLGAIGVYGVLSYIVSQRSREIGVRMALGAEAADVTRMILRQGATVVGVGILVGLAGAFVLTRLMTAILFGVGPADPLTFAVVAVVLGLTALAASWLPARRAARVDPLAALRSN